VKPLLCCSLACICCILPARAESNRFIGGNLQIGTGYQLNTPTLNNYSNSQSTASSTITGIPLVLGLGYTISLNNRAVMGLSYNRNLVNTASGAQATSSSGTVTNSSLGYSSQQQYSLLGGYLLNNFSMIYGKLGYATLTTTNAEKDFSLNGYGLGLGYKSFLNDFYYLFTEYNQTRLSNTGIVSATSGVTYDGRSTGHEIVFGIGLQF